MSGHNRAKVFTNSNHGSFKKGGSSGRNSRHSDRPPNERGPSNRQHRTLQEVKTTSSKLEETNIPPDSWEEEHTPLIEPDKSQTHSFTESIETKQDMEEKNIRMSSKSSGRLQGMHRTSNKAYSRDSDFTKHSNSRDERYERNYDNDSGRQQKRMENVTRQSYDWQRDDVGKLYDLYYKEYKDKKTEYTCVKEIDADLFSLGKEFCLAHCVAEDLNMGSGIAVTFRQEFKSIGELLEQRQKQGGVAVLKESDRYIYYLITKRESNGKPTYQNLFRSLHSLRDHMKAHDMNLLAAPRLGCGLDRLEWIPVKNMLQMLFQDTGIQVTVCNFQQAEEQMQMKKENHKYRQCRLVMDPRPITSLEAGTIILYIGSEDGHISPELELLDKKFGVIRKYRTETRTAGQFLYSSERNGDYAVYGCIVKSRQDDDFSYKHFSDIVKNINRENNKKKFEKYNYVGMQQISDKDDLVMAKMINILRNTFHGIELYICTATNYQFN